MEECADRGNYRLRVLRPSCVEPCDVAAWLELEERALEPNAYLSPLFVLPALRTISDARHLKILCLECNADVERRFDAVAVLVESGPDRELPLKHHKAFLSPHSFVGGVLVARKHAAYVVAALHDHMCQLSGHGIALPQSRLDGETDILLQSVSTASGLVRIEKDVYQRAVMTPADLGDEFIATHLSGRSKRLRSSRRKLEKIGTVDIVVRRGRDVTDDVVERHVALEHMGWKAENGTSLRSNPDHEAFFRKMASSFAERGRAIFVELSVGDRVIASTSNFTAGRKGFAYKIGFDPEFSDYSPGILCELELMRLAPTVLGDLELFDSGAVVGSYIEALWPGRQRFGTAIYATTRAGCFAASAVNGLRQAKQAINRLGSWHRDGRVT